MTSTRASSGQGTTLQASCVAIGGRGILIAGSPGIGKSSLALALIDRGATLVGDDGVGLTARSDGLWASPHPNTRGLLEVRNLGILPFDVTDDVRVCLMLQLDAAAPRFVDRADQQSLAGVDIPFLRLWPDSPILAVRAEWALRRYGLR